MLGRLLRGVAEEAEVPAVGYACGAFCCVLSAHYLLLPMREEAGLALGVDTLPVLFTTSLAVTLMAAPACAGVLARARRGEGHVRLFTGLAGILIFLYAALCLTPPLLPSPPDASAATQLPPAVAALAPFFMPPARRALYAFFYVWLGVMNLAGTSALWALAADVFEPASAARVFGALGAGATAGQLMGSIAAVGAARMCASLRLSPGVVQLMPAAGVGEEDLPHSVGGGPPAALLLASAALMLTAGRLASRFAACAPAHRQRPAATDTAPPHAAVHTHVVHTGGGPGVRVSRTARRAWLALAAAVPTSALEGASLVWRSHYLVTVCGYMGLQYTSSAVLYFIRALVVSSHIHGASARSAYFGSINVAVALATLTVQTLATGRIIARAGVRVILCLSPVVALLGMGIITAAPLPGLIAGVEVVRKVIGHSLTRPSREVLFTVVTRQEKYKAKVVMDMAVQRCGDVAAAALFQAMHVHLGLGAASITAVGFLVCAAWLVVARHLGMQYAARAAGHGHGLGAKQPDDDKAALLAPSKGDVV